MVVSNCSEGRRHLAENPGRAPYAVARDCRSRQLNTHDTEFREVRYRWIHGSVVRSRCMRSLSSRGTVCRCRLEERNRLSIEVPTWMFAPTACVRLRVMTAPAISCEALRALKASLRTVSRSVDDGVLQLRHRPCLRQEALMRHSVIPPRRSQPTLFRPFPSRPVFHRLPPEI